MFCDLILLPCDALNIIMLARTITLVFVLTISSNLSWGQISLKEVQMDRIPYVRVQEYLEHHMKLAHSTFLDLEPTLKPLDEVIAYNKQTLKFKIKSKQEEVWQYYSNVSPKEAWNSNKIGFCLLFSKNTSQLFYSDDPIEKVSIGQIVLLNLKLLGGIYNAAVGFEITSIDPVKQSIEFSYIKGNISHGKQQLLFQETKNGFTEITHISYFKSGSLIRDFLFYPFFHKRVTKDFHHNMKSSLMKEGI